MNVGDRYRKDTPYITMPELTRHLYRLDECISACMFCTSHGRTREAVFWAAELIRSDHACEAIYSLIYAWLFTIGPLRLEWFRRAWELFRREEIEDTCILQFTVALSSSISQKPVLDKGVTEETTFTSTKDTTAMLLCVGKTLYEREKPPQLLQEFRAAAALGWKGLERAAGADGRLRQLFAALQDLEACVGKEYAERLAPMAFAVGFLSLKLKKDQKEASWRPILLKDLDTDMKVWITEKKGVWRDDRVFEVPYMCLYGMTDRGNLSQKETTLNELRLNLDSMLKRGGWWMDYIQAEYPMLLEEGEGSDEARERFYDTEFPQDIPDEWSLPDQQKSHGMGAAIGTDPCSVPRLLERWFPVERSAWWNGADCRSLWKHLRAQVGLEACLGF